MSLAVAKDLVEERAQLALLAREVELGVVGQGLGQVQLDEPDQNVGQGQIKSGVTLRIKYFRVGQLSGEVGDSLVRIESLVGLCLLLQFVFLNVCLVVFCCLRIHSF